MTTTTAIAVPAPSTPSEFKALTLVEMRAYLETKPRAPERITEIYSGLCRWTDTMWPLCVFLYERCVAYMDMALDVYRDEVHSSPFFWECVGSVMQNATKRDKPILALILRRTTPHYPSMVRIGIIPFAQRRASVHWRKTRFEIFDFLQELALPAAFYEARLDECVRLIDANRHCSVLARVDHDTILERKLVSNTGPFARRMLEKTILINCVDAERIAAYFYEEQLDDEFIDIMMSHTPLTRAKVAYFQYQYCAEDLRALLMRSRWWFAKFDIWFASEMHLMAALCHSAQLDCSRQYNVDIVTANSESRGVWHPAAALFSKHMTRADVQLVVYNTMFTHGACPLRNVPLPEYTQSISDWLFQPHHDYRKNLSPNIFICLFAVGDTFSAVAEFQEWRRNFRPQPFSGEAVYPPADLFDVILAGTLLNAGDAGLRRFHDICQENCVAGRRCSGCVGRNATYACLEKHLYAGYRTNPHHKFEPIPRPEPHRAILNKRAELAQRQWRTQARCRSFEIAVALRTLALPDLVVYKIINKALPWLSAKCVPMHKKYNIAKLVHDARVGVSKEEFVQQLHAQKRALKMQ